MPLFKLSNSSIEQVPDTSFDIEGLKERTDLQSSIRDYIDIVAPDTLVLAEEYGQWEDSRRRIDLLAVDRSANLVVIELKRTLDGGHMDLQAIRYASMVSNMTFDQAVQAHANYLDARDREEDAKEQILEFLGWEDSDENDFAQEVRIVLASAEFSRELTTSVLWLRDHDVDISCVRLKPYRIGDVLLINAEQLIPLPEAEDYQIKVREKTRKERAERKQSRDFTKYDVSVDGETLTGLPKRRAIHRVIKALANKGVTIDEISEQISWRNPKQMWRIVDGEADSEQFVAAATSAANAGGPAFDPRRWFTDDDELIYSQGSTCALTKMWGNRTADAMQALLDRYPGQGVRFEESEPASV